MATSVPRVVIDGSMPYGTFVATISGQPYKFNSFNITRNTTDAMDNDIDGTPGRMRKTAGVATFTAEVQLPSADTPWPKFGDRFTAPVLDPNYGAEEWALDQPNYNVTNAPGDIRVATFTGWKIINPSDYTTVGTQP